MSLPLMYDSDDGDSLAISDVTVQEHPEETVRTAFDINPDEVEMDLYLAMVEEEGLEEEVKEYEVLKKPEKKPRTLEDVEEQLVYVCLGEGSIFQTLYLLHEHFSKSSAQNAKEKNETKHRIMSKIYGKVSKQRENEISTILQNFFC